MSFDNLCKLLSEKYPDRFASWVLGKTQQSVEVLKTELSIEPIRADSVTFLQLQGRLLHLEFHTKLESNPPLPLRMIDYWVRLYRLYRLPITQIIVLLLPPSEDTVIETAFIVENTRHEYQVLRLWEQEPEIFLNDSALLPLATLAATTDSEALLRDTAQRVNQLELDRRQEVSTYTQILAGLKFEKALIQKIFREGMMRESVIYQDILEEGREKGREEG
ncbi:MAG: Rpn family recombination-promoting nuclease/putative transposase, partial [Leptolyngbyaceae cyanobacterium CAN_BIN12]|nr:Rpn family recombination-promoting nuclease/putative transposase [Leptolyngbyaceae cyanobacterium CAN_BIN12]